MSSFIAVAHATKGTSFVVRVTDENKIELSRLREDPVRAPGKKEKTHFLSTIKKGDTVALENGGAADRLALACVAFGASVLRYPSFLLNPEECVKIAARGGFADMKEERGYGAETGDELTQRRTRAYALFTLLREKADGFLTLQMADLSLLQLKIAYRAYSRAFKATMRSYQGLISSYRDQIFLSVAARKQQLGKISQEDLYSELLENVLKDVLGGNISETERSDFFAIIGKEFEGGKFPTEATEEDISKLVMAMIESDTFKSTVFDRLKEQKKQIEYLLAGRRAVKTKNVDEIPANEIYTKVFEPIPGCGPLIAARVISAIVDIRRFPTNGSLRAYAGYHNFPDGSRARRVAGKVSNWNTNLKQGVYLWCDGTVKLKNSPRRHKLDARKAYELVKILKARQLMAMDQNLDVELLPKEFLDRDITSVMSMKPGDYPLLTAHVDELRKTAGVTSESEDDEEEKQTVRDPKLAKLVKGVKAMAHQKGMRWLGQQFLSHVFYEWRKALGLPMRTAEGMKVNLETEFKAGLSISEIVSTETAVMISKIGNAIKEQRSVTMNLLSKGITMKRACKPLRLGTVMDDDKVVPIVEVQDELRGALRYFVLDRVTDVT